MDFRVGKELWMLLNAIPHYSDDWDGQGGEITREEIFNNQINSVFRTNVGQLRATWDLPNATAFEIAHLINAKLKQKNLKGFNKNMLAEFSNGAAGEERLNQYLKNNDWQELLLKADIRFTSHHLKGNALDLPLNSVLVDFFKSEKGKSLTKAFNLEVLYKDDHLHVGARPGINYEDLGLGVLDDVWSQSFDKFKSKNGLIDLRDNKAWTEIFEFEKDLSQAIGVFKNTGEFKDLAKLEIEKDDPEHTLYYLSDNNKLGLQEGLHMKFYRTDGSSYLKFLPEEHVNALWMVDRGQNTHTQISDLIPKTVFKSTKPFEEFLKDKKNKRIYNAYNIFQNTSIPNDEQNRTYKDLPFEEQYKLFGEAPGRKAARQAGVTYLQTNWSTAATTKRKKIFKEIYDINLGYKDEQARQSIYNLDDSIYDIPDAEGELNKVDTFPENSRSFGGSYTLKSKDGKTFILDINSNDNIPTNLLRDYGDINKWADRTFSLADLPEDMQGQGYSPAGYGDFKPDAIDNFKKLFTIENIPEGLSEEDAYKLAMILHSPANVPMDVQGLNFKSGNFKSSTGDIYTDLYNSSGIWNNYSLISQQKYGDIDGNNITGPQFNNWINPTVITPEGEDIPDQAIEDPSGDIPSPDAGINNAPDPDGNFFKKFQSTLKGIGGVPSLIAGVMGVKGLQAANKKIRPQEMPELSPLFKKHLFQTQELSKSGFTPAEKQNIKNQIDKAYKIGMENIVRGTGGDRAKYLAASGVLDSNRASALLDFAAKDAEQRRANQGNFLKMLEFKENYDMQKNAAERKFDLEQQLADKKGGAELGKAAFSYLAAGHNKNRYNQSYLNALVGANQGVNQFSSLLGPYYQQILNQQTTEE